MTIGALARRAGLSRSTLLYYDRIGLLRPSGRTPSGYRVYTDADAQRLEQLRLYRSTGLPLAKIRSLMRAGAGDEGSELLHAQLRRLGEQIEDLRARQRVVARLLRKPRLAEDASPTNRKTWTALLRAAGFDDAAMWRWHVDFERTAPGEHQRFLEFLNIPEDDIRRIRRRSRKG